MQMELPLPDNQPDHFIQFVPSLQQLAALVNAILSFPPFTITHLREDGVEFKHGKDELFIGFSSKGMNRQVNLIYPMWGATAYCLRVVKGSQFRQLAVICNFDAKTVVESFLTVIQVMGVEGP